jgi:hypothetical protein
MRTASIAVSSAHFAHARTPGVVWLAHDLKILFSAVIRVTKKPSNH